MSLHHSLHFSLTHYLTLLLSHCILPKIADGKVASDWIWTSLDVTIWLGKKWSLRDSLPFQCTGIPPLLFCSLSTQVALKCLMFPVTFAAPQIVPFVCVCVIIFFIHGVWGGCEDSNPHTVAHTSSSHADTNLTHTRTYLQTVAHTHTPHTHKEGESLQDL